MWSKKEQKKMIKTKISNLSEKQSKIMITMMLNKLGRIEEYFSDIVSKEKQSKSRNTYKGHIDKAKEG